MDDEYIFIPGLDQPGNDSIEANSVGFNTLGVFKSAITTLVPGSGIHIKKDIYNQYLNNNKWKKKEQVKGIILIISCHKYLNTRVNDFVKSKKNLNEIDFAEERSQAKKDVEKDLARLNELRQKAGQQ